MKKLFLLLIFPTIVFGVTQKPLITGTSIQANYLAINGKADDSDKLDNNDSTYFLSADSSTATNIQKTGGVQGQVLYYNGTEWTPLAPATSGQMLTTQGTGQNPKWTQATGDTYLSKLSLQFYPLAGISPSSGGSGAQVYEFATLNSTECVQNIVIPLGTKTTMQYELITISTDNYRLTGLIKAYAIVYTTMTSVQNIAQFTLTCLIDKHSFGNIETRAYTTNLFPATSGSSTALYDSLITTPITGISTTVTGYYTFSFSLAAAVGYDVHIRKIWIQEE